MPQANPLTLYVPIKQGDTTIQLLAQAAYDNFVASATKGLESLNIVHYARIALIPYRKPGTVANIEAMLIITEFDGDMLPYLKAFWGDGDGSTGIGAAFQLLMKLAANNPDPGGKITYEMYTDFIINNNLSKPSDNFAAYPWQVQQILKVMPKPPKE